MFLSFTGLLLCLLGSFSFSTLAQERHPGYVSDVKKEKHLKVVEFVLPPKPAKVNYDLRKLIFTKDFSKDMTKRYQRKFGYTEAQINITTPNRFEEFTSFDGTRVTVEEDVKRKRKFAGYMLRKLTEYHVDNYLKSNEETKKIYEVKQKISNTQVGLAGGFKLRAKYSFSGKTIKLKLKNPYNLWNELVIDLDPDRNEFEDDDVNYIISAGFPIFWKMRLNNYYNFSKSDLTTVFARSFSKNLGVNLTNIYSFNKFNLENKIIVGLDWRY